MTETKQRKKPGPKPKKKPIQRRRINEIINESGAQVVIEPPKTPPMKHPGGRPTKLTPEMQDRARLVVDNIMSQGGSALEVAYELGISRETLYDWKKNNQEFSDTITKGMMSREIWFEKQARNNVNNKEYNTGLFGLYAMNSVGWSRRDKVTNEVTVSTTVQEAANKRLKKVEDE